MKKSLLVLTTFIGLSMWAQPYHWRHVNAESSVYTQLPASSSTILAGDRAGFIKKTNNTGLNWEIVYRGDATSINDIAFVDANKGFATCLQQGLFLTTNDGGQSWKQNIMLDSLGIPVTQHFHTVEIIDSSTLIINGTFHTGKRAFISTNKGASFTELAVPGNVVHVEGDTLLAFGQGGFTLNISLSVDLGKTWTLVKSGPGLGSNNFYYNGYDQVSVISSKVFFLSSNDSNPDGVFRTLDGGLTFTMLPDPANNFYPDYVNFSSASTGIIAGRISSAGYGFFSTTDAGQNWTALYSTNTYTGQLKPPFLPIGSNTLFGQRYFHSVVSTDGGLTFTDNSDDFIPVGTYMTQDIQVANQDNLYAYTVLGPVSWPTADAKLSSDGGMNWFDMKDSSGTLLENVMGNMQVISADTVLYTYGNSIRRFVKNGSGSGRVIYSKTGFGSSINRMVRSGSQLLAFTSSYVYYSSDRGRTWNSKSGSLNTGDNKIIQFTDFSNIYALQNTQLLKSTDTGRTWVDVTNGITLSTIGTSSTMGMTVKSANEVIVYGTAGRLYRTTDAGQNWTDLKPNLPQTPVDLRYYNFRFMEFRDNMIGYAGDRAANGGRYVLQTLDGGVNWSFYNGGQSMVVPMDMHFADTATAYMIGGVGPNVVRYYSDANYVTDTVTANGQVSSGTALGENSFNAISIYPNPAGHYCRVDGVQVNKAWLYNLQGEKIPLPNVNNNRISKMAPGMYILMIEDVQKQLFNHKLMIH